MEIGIIGLGKMGGKIAERLLRHGHHVVVYARTAATVESIVELGATGASSFEDFVEKVNGFEKPLVWVMLPSGEVTNEMLKKLSEVILPNGIIIDGGNSNFNNTIENAKLINSTGRKFMDVGTSGGIWGLERGYSLMIGGDKESYEYVKPIFHDLAPENGYGYMGSHGAGHFVKMVHNGVEYGMMQAYGEGFEILKKSKHYDLDLKEVSKIWKNGSIVDSFLLQLIVNMFNKNENLDNIKGYVEDSGEGRWTVQAAIDEAVSAPIITLSLMQRFRSRQEETFTDKVLAGLRNEFGGHAVKYKEK